MPANGTLTKLKEIMSDVFDVSIADLDVTPETTAKDIEDWDSLSHVRLMVAIERKFKIKFKNSEIEAMTNVGELLKLIASKTTTEA
jgi:acyl carrier protein